MHKRLSRARRNKSEENQRGWDWAISEVRSKIVGLETAIHVFEERKAAGEPWPGTQAAGQTLEAATRS
jgi:hypothetical protein